MITVDEYFQNAICDFGFTPSTSDRTAAGDLISAVNKLLEEFFEDTGEEPDAYSISSGYRTAEKTRELQAAGYGAATSGTHTTAHGVDIADPQNKLDSWIDDGKLERFGLYRENPMATLGGQRGSKSNWCHLQDLPPHSGHRTYWP